MRKRKRDSVRDGWKSQSEVKPERAGECNKKRRQYCGQIEKCEQKHTIWHTKKSIIFELSSVKCPANTVMCALFCALLLFALDRLLRHRNESITDNTVVAEAILGNIDT